MPKYDHSAFVWLQRTHLMWRSIKCISVPHQCWIRMTFLKFTKKCSQSKSPQTCRSHQCDTFGWPIFLYVNHDSRFPFFFPLRFSYVNPNPPPDIYRPWEATLVRGWGGGKNNLSALCRAWISFFGGLKLLVKVVFSLCPTGDMCVDCQCKTPLPPGCNCDPEVTITNITNHHANHQYIVIWWWWWWL